MGVQKPKNFEVSIELAYQEFPKGCWWGVGGWKRDKASGGGVADLLLNDTLLLVNKASSVSF